MITQDSEQRLLAWRSKIAGELAEANKALPGLEAQYQMAVDAAYNAANGYSDLQRVLGTIESLAGPLIRCSQDHKMELDAARGGRAKALGALEVTKARIDEWSRALAQIDQLLAPENAQAAA